VRRYPSSQHAALPFRWPSVLHGCKGHATLGYASLDAMIVRIYGRDAPWRSVERDIAPVRATANATVARTGATAGEPAPAAGWPQAVGRWTAGSGPGHPAPRPDRRGSAGRCRSQRSVRQLRRRIRSSSRAGHNPGWRHVCVFAAIGRKRRRILRTGRSRSSPVPRGPPSHGHGGTVAAPSGGGSQWPVRADPRPARLRPSRCRRHRRPHPAVRAPASAADGRPRAPVRRTAVPHHPPT
jgi:hypothetical protein